MKGLTVLGLTWRTCRFDELGLHELDAVYRARQLVFCVEQNCPYLDADGFDEHSLHLIGKSREHTLPAAYARIVAPGYKYAEPSIGRVLTSDFARGTGAGRDLLNRAIAACAATYPGAAMRISAQARLQRFYSDAGFIVAGEPYDEDGIAHIEMLRDA